MVENRDFFILSAFGVPVTGVLVEHCHNVWYGKTNWCGYPMVKKFENLLVSTQHVNVTDRQTDGQTPDRAYA